MLVPSSPIPMDKYTETKGDMMMKHYKIGFLIILAACFIMFPFMAQAGEFNYTLDGTNLLVDGYVRSDWVNNTALGFVRAANVVIGVPVNYRGYFAWNLSALPDDITITDVYFLYQGLAQHDQDCNLVGITINPLTSNNRTLYWNIGNGTIYYPGAGTGFPIVGVNQELEVNNAGLAEIQAAYAAGQDWIALGLRLIDEAAVPPNTTDITSSEAGAPTPEPTLVVEFNYPYQYTFSDTYFENGNVTASINVTATGPGFSDEFNVTGGYTYGYDIEPTLFYWSIGGGATRRIYTRSGIMENYTVTIPDADFDTYVFTV